MFGSKSSQTAPQALALTSQENPVYQKLGFHTACGTQWFEFSPEKVKGYFYELGEISVGKRFFDDISFSSVLEMSSLNVDDLEDGPVFGSSLGEVLDSKVRDDARADILQRVCGHILYHVDHQLLRQQVNELVEADLKAAGIATIPDSNIYLKSNHLALHLARESIIRQPRDSDKEIRVHLSRLARRQAGNLAEVKLYLSETTSFESFLETLRQETALQNDKGGFTLEDGPWKYKLMETGQATGLWCDLMDEASFGHMLEKMKSSEREAIIIHSVEDALQRKYEKEKEEERREWQDEEVILDSDGKPFFSGTRYMEYLECSYDSHDEG